MSANAGRRQSRPELGGLLDNDAFDLVLGLIGLDSDNLYPLIGLQEGSRTTLFFFQSVENGCRWLPALCRGLNCVGVPTYRPGEFGTVLDETIEAIRSNVRITVEIGEAQILGTRPQFSDWQPSGMRKVHDRA